MLTFIQLSVEGHLGCSHHSPGVSHAEPCVWCSRECAALVWLGSAVSTPEHGIASSSSMDPATNIVASLHLSISHERAEDMAKAAKRLPHKREYLSSNPQNPNKKLGLQ